MNDSEIRRWVDVAADEIKDLLRSTATSEQLRQIDRIMERLKSNLRNR